ncbi:XkdW family protein [Bradyrhizobium sp. USDA 4350]
MYRPERFIDAVRSLRPGIDPRTDFLAVDHSDGNGPQIAAWYRADVTQPTQAEIEAVDTDALPSPVPQTVTPRQARLALLAAGLLDQVEAAVKTAGGATQITWDYATEVNRSDPMIAQIGASLNLTAAQIDALFVQAATL